MCSRNHEYIIYIVIFLIVTFLSVFFVFSVFEQIMNNKWLTNISDTLIKRTSQKFLERYEQVCKEIKKCICEYDGFYGLTCSALDQH